MQFRPEWIQRVKQGLRGWFARTGNNTDITSVHLNYLDLAEQASIANPDADKARLAVIDAEGITAVVYRSSTGFESRVLRDRLFVIRNTSASTLTKGTVVRVSGVNGNGATAAVTVVPAQANAAASMPAFGIMAQDVAANASGRCLVVGRIDGLNTSAFAALDLLYVSPTTAGGLTNVRPSAPNRAQPVAQVVNSHASAGAITVMIGPVLNEALSTVQPSFTIGNGSAGAKELRFFANGFTTTIQVNPTANLTAGPVLDAGNQSIAGNKTFTGKVFQPNVSIARANQSASQSVAAQTFTKILYANEELDALGEYDPATAVFTAADTGVYLVHASIQWSNLADGNQTALEIFVNGVSRLRLSDQRQGSAGNIANMGAGIVRLTAGNTLDVRAYSLAAASTLGSQGAISNFTITRVS